MYSSKHKQLLIMAYYELKEMPDMRDEGKRRVYPKLKRQETVSFKSFIHKLKRYNRAIPESTWDSLMMDVSKVLAEELANGHTVKIDGLGVFSLSLEFADDKATEMTSDDEKLNYRKVKVRDILYRPDKELLKEVRNEAKFERETGGVKKLKVVPFTYEQRRDNAINYICSHGFMNLRTYVEMNGVSRTQASLDLKKIEQDPESHIGSTGNRTHKIWVEKK